MTNAEPSKKTYVVRGADRLTGESRVEVIVGAPSQRFITHIVSTMTDGRGVAIADLNDDGLVNGADLAILLVGWGEDQGFGADLTGDGLVNGSDLALLLINWG